MEYGDSFAKELISTTKDWGKYWLNDRVLARRPWVQEKEHGTIDNFLRDLPAFQNRLLPEDYAVSRYHESIKRQAK
jgi:lipopolysaccharide biosynthesis protein